MGPAAGGPDLPGPSRRRILGGPSGLAHAVDASPDGAWLAAAVERSGWFLCETGSGRLLPRIPKAKDEARADVCDVDLRRSGGRPTPQHVHTQL